tara:strand:+ start:998 stop:1507 length:510 start_codon:yes stop_codon:yes gene_type:complete
VNLIDIILYIALGFGLIKGFFKGFIVEVASLGALFLGLLGAFKCSGFLTDLLKEFVDWNPIAIKTVAYLIIFMIIVYGVSVLARAMTKIISKASLGLFNKFLGASFGMLKWAVLMSVGLFFVGKLNSWVSLLDEGMIESSLLYQPIKALGEFLFDWGSTMTHDLPEDTI